MIRSIIAAAGVVLCAAASVGAQQEQGRDAATFNWTKQMAAGSRLTIENANGPIMVREATGDQVEVRATKVPHGRSSIRDVAFDVRESGGDVDICTLYSDQSDCHDHGRFGRNINVRVEFTVLIPRTLRVNLSTGNGDVTLDRAGAEVSVSTGNGKVMIGQTTGSVDVSSGNGDVRVESADGPVKVSTGNGRVSVTTARGAVNASTGNGEIDVLTKALTSDANMSFTSGSGAIHVTLPSDYNGRIDASTGNGSLRSDFEISVVGRLDPQHMRGTIGKGGPLLRLTTGNGSIELRKN